jgi:hypothetical protein
MQPEQKKTAVDAVGEELCGLSRRILVVLQLLLRLAKEKGDTALKVQPPTMQSNTKPIGGYKEALMTLFCPHALPHLLVQLN